LTLDADAGLLGFLLMFDSRNNEWNPSKGLLFDAKFELGREKLANDFSFEALRLTFSQYFEIKPGHVLAYNVHACSVWGDAPFFDLCTFGSANTLRGYVAGQYRDYAMAAIQAEYRWKLNKKIGLVFFAGVGAVAADLGKLGEDGWLPSAGVGVRYVVSDAFGINLGIDYARGKNSDALYIRVGEAF
jgi:outer membrane protein assembly factor BamA